MVQHKRIGTITMVIPILVFITFFMFSEDTCSSWVPAAKNAWSWITLCKEIVIVEDAFGISGQYVIIGCISLFAIGFLWFSGALALPKQLSEHVNEVTDVSPS